VLGAGLECSLIVSANRYLLEKRTVGEFRNDHLKAIFLNTCENESTALRN